MKRVILNESINKLSSVSQSTVLMGYEFSETNFNKHNRQTYLYMFRDHISKKSQKTNIQRSSNGTKLFDGYKKKSQFNGYFNFDFDDFLQIHSLTLYEYNE